MDKVRGVAEAGGLEAEAEGSSPAGARGRRLAGGWGPAKAGGLVAEAGGWPSAEAGGRVLAEAACVADAVWVVTAVTKEVLILRELVSTSSPADAPQRRHYKA